MGAVAVAISATLFSVQSPYLDLNGGGYAFTDTYAPEKTVFTGAKYVTAIRVPQFALSPDGRTIVFAAGARNGKPMLWVKSMEEISGGLISWNEAESFRCVSG